MTTAYHQNIFKLSRELDAKKIGQFIHILVPDLAEFDKLNANLYTNFNGYKVVSYADRWFIVEEDRRNNNWQIKYKSVDAPPEFGGTKDNELYKRIKV